MAKKISLQLEINGVKQSVSNIEDLEKSITEMKNQLKGVDIGSEEFKKLSGEIRKAQNFAEDLNESLKPQELEKRVGAYAKVGSAIVSSFAAAQATISLFGEESEDVARAAAKAQAVLTIALTAREAAEGLVALKTVAANIATVASAAAANTANVATRALYTTLAANPYGAILAVVGAVAGALIYFGDSEEEVVDVTKELNQVVSESALVLQTQLRILQEGNVSEQGRLITIEKLKKEYPGFNAFIDKENQLTKDGVTYIGLKIEQMKSEARVKILLQKLDEIEKKNLELTTKDVEKQIGFFEDLLGAIKSVATLSPGESARVTLIRETTDELIKNAEQRNKVNNLIQNEVELQGQLSEKLKPLETTLERQVQIQNELVNATKRSADEQKRFNEEYLRAKNQLPDLTNALKKLLKSYGDLDTQLKNLASSQLDVKIVEDLKKIAEQRKLLLDQTISDVERFSMESKKLFEIPRDVFYDEFVKFRLGLEQLLASPEKPISKFQEYFTNFIEQTKQGGKEFNQEQIKTLQSLLNTYKQIEFQFKSLGTDPNKNPIYLALKNINSVLPPNSVEWKKNKDQINGAYGVYSSFFDFLGEQLASEGVFLREVGDTRGELEKLLTFPDFDESKAKQNVQDVLNFLENQLLVPFREKLAKELIKEQQLRILDPRTLKLDKEIALQLLDKYQKEFEKFQKDGGKISFIDEVKVKEGIQVFLQGLKDFNFGANEFEQNVFEVKVQVDEATKSLEDLGKTSQITGQFLKNNLSNILPKVFGIETETQKNQKKKREEAKKDFIGLSNFYFRLVQDETTREETLRIKSMDDLLDAYIEFKDAEVDVNKRAEQTKLNDINETSTKIGEYVQVFSSTVNQIASLTNQSIQNQIDFLEKSTKAQLDQVVGNTESAEKKRTEIREQYNEERKELEKKATIQSLRFALVQSIANAAQSITGIYASLSSTGPAALILAGIQSAIIAGITTAEIAIINEQINTAEMFRRGGLVKAQGGMLLSGPTHEQGGIPLAQMGIIAEGQEAIINRNSLINYRDLLSTVNQAGGGRPLVVNSFDDTRIVEAIASQRQKPLRAYVLQSEITNEQALSKRLDDLSKI